MLELKVKSSGSTSGGIVLTESQKTAIASVSSPVPKGGRRDWYHTARVILNNIPQDAVVREVEEVPQDAVSGYQSYLLMMGHRFQGVLKGNGPKIGGIQTPTASGESYEKSRENLLEALDDVGIRWDSRRMWYRVEDGTKLRIQVVNRPDPQDVEENVEK